MKLSTFIIAASAVVASGISQAAAQESSYTRHKYDTCAKTESPEPGIIEVHRCPGKAGIAVRWISEPDSSSVSFGENPLDEALDIGGAFEVGSTIEWRSARKGGTPIAAIVRYRAGAGITHLTKSVLVVYRLEPSGASCVMAVLGPDGNQARRVVDQHAQSFVCGKSSRVRG